MIFVSSEKNLTIKERYVSIMTNDRNGWPTQKSVEVTLEHMAKDPDKLYPKSELDINDLINLETSFKLVIKELLSSGAVQEVSENTYKITTKGLERVVDELKKEILELIQSRSNEDYYTLNGIQEALSEKKLAKIVFQKAIEKICQEDYLERVKIRDETTNIENIFYDVTERVIMFRKELRTQYKKTRKKWEKEAKKKPYTTTRYQTHEERLQEERNFKFDMMVADKKRKERRGIIIIWAVIIGIVVLTFTILLIFFNS